MAQLTWYLKAATGNWDDANAWNDQADGLGTDRTNPQNGADTYICDLNAKAVTINVAVSVDKIRTGATNAGGTIAVPNSGTSTITVATATTGLYSNFNGTLVTWGTGTCSLTINGDAQYASTSTSGGIAAPGASQTIVINGKLTNSSSGYALVPSSTSVVTITNAGGTALSGTGSGRCISGTGTVSVTGDASFTAGVGWLIAGGTATFTGNAVGSLNVRGLNVSGGTLNIVGNLQGTGDYGGLLDCVGGTVNWTGSRTLTASADLGIVMNGGTLNLATASAALSLANSGSITLFKTSGTLTITAAGGTASIVNQSSTSYAAFIGCSDAQKAIITGPTLPAANKVKFGQAQFGYTGSLLTPDYYPPNLDANPGVEAAAAVLTTAHYGEANVVVGTAAGGGGGRAHIIGG